MERNIKSETLHFEKTNEPGKIKDSNTSSVWNMKEQCVEGELEGTQLNEIQSYDNFHPGSEESYFFSFLS